MQQLPQAIHQADHLLFRGRRISQLSGYQQHGQANIGHPSFPQLPPEIVGKLAFDLLRSLGQPLEADLGQDRKKGLIA